MGLLTTQKSMAKPVAKPSSSNRIDNCCQILMCGDGGAGKSALAIGFVGGDLNQQNYNPTIHDQYHMSNFNVDGINVGRIDIKDVQGQEEYLNIRLQTISDCDAFILVYDITQKSSFTELNKWIKEIKETKLKENEYKGIPIVLVGMKCDLEYKRQVKQSEGQQLASSLNDCPFYEACSTQNKIINVQNVFESTIREWRKYEQYSVTKYSNKVKKRKQKSKMENFLNGFGLFNKNNNNDNDDDEKQLNKNVSNNPDNNNTNNDDEKEKTLLMGADMDNIIDEMYKEESQRHLLNIDAIERQKASATPAGPDNPWNNVNAVYNEGGDVQQEGVNEGNQADTINETALEQYPTPEIVPSAPPKEENEQVKEFDDEKLNNGQENGSNLNVDLGLYHFKKFLSDLKLTKYENIFIENGYGDLEKMLYLDDEDLKSDDFKIKTADRKFLLRKLDGLNKDHAKFKNWLEEIVKLPLYAQPLYNKGVITLKILIESIDVKDKQSLRKLIKFYSDDHLNIFWVKIQDYLHPSQSAIDSTFM